MPRVGRRAPAMKPVKKSGKNKKSSGKVLSSTSLSKAIADKQFVDTMKEITKYLERNKHQAPRVMHLLKSNMLDPEEVQESDKLPQCVNKYRLLSLQNIQDLVKVIGASGTIEAPVIQGFLQIKTKTSALQLFAMWMRVQENSALISRVFSALADECVRTATAHREFINKTTFIGNGKPGRFQGMVADFGSHGVFSYADLNEQLGVFESMVHNSSGIKVAIEEVKPKPGWTIECNFNEYEASAKGPRGRHQVVPFFESADSTDKEPKYKIPMPHFASAIAAEVATGASASSGNAPVPIANVPAQGPRRRLARRASAASSVRSEPEGDGLAFD